MSRRQPSAAVSRRQRSRPTRSIAPSARQFDAEHLERRLLLAAAVQGAIPARIDPAADAGQTLFVPGVSDFTVTGPATGVTPHYYRFATDSAADAQPATFYISPAPGIGADAGLALYDGDGNRLATADNDFVAGQPGAEQLTATLQSGRTYVLGTFLGSQFLTPRPFNVGVDLGAQNTNAPVRLDPDGTAYRPADSGDDTFNSPRDVDFYPIDFVNAGATGTVRVSATAVDVRLRATLWRFDPQAGPLAANLPGDSSWQQVATGSGDPVDLTVTPPAGGNLTDGRYVLAVAPLDFDSPARTYQIEVDGRPLLAPADLNGLAETANLGTFGPLSPGKAGATVNGNLAAGGTAVYRFRAPATGTVTATLNSNVFAPVMALYDAGGASINLVGSRTSNGSLVRTFSAVAGQEYAIAVVSNTSAGAGAFTLQLAQSYTPTPLALVNNAATLNGLSVGGASGGQIFRVALPPGSDVVSLLVSPDAGSAAVPTITVVSPGLAAPVTRAGVGGAPLETYFDARTFGSEIDVFVTSGPEGPVSLTVGAADVPDQFPLGSTPLATLDLGTGDASATPNAGAAGAVSAFKFYALKTGTTGDFVATPLGAARAAVAQYVESDGVLRLAGFALPGADGSARRTAADVLSERFAAVAAITLRPGAGGDQFQLTFNGQRPIGNGIAMAPEPLPRLSPSDPIDNRPPASRLSIRTVKLARAEQRDLWETLLPYNATAGNPTLRIGPPDGDPAGGVAVKLTVLDDQNNPLATFTTNPNQVLNQPLPALAMPANAGKKVRFLVEPAAGQPLGDGLYTLELYVPTTNPLPFQVTESKFNVAWQGPGTNSIPRFEPITTLPVGGTGLVGQFTSSLPYNTGPDGNTGSIDVYRFTHGPTPFEVHTELTNPAEGLNTNIKLYRGNTSGGLLPSLDEIDGFGPNFDYFAADRSQVDAKIVVTNTDAMRAAFQDPRYSFGTNTWYVVVKNEQGTQGQYRIKVNDVPYESSGPGALPGSDPGVGAPRLWINPLNGNSDTLTNVNNFDYLRLFVPQSLFGQPTVKFDFDNAGLHSIRVDVFDAATQALVYRSAAVTASTTASFALAGIVPPNGYLVRPVFSGQPSTLRATASATVLSAFAGLKPGPQGITYPDYHTPSDAYQRAVQSPDGTFVARNVGGGSGTQDKTVFWVSAPGKAHFLLTTSNLKNRIFTLWRGEFTSGEISSIYGRPVDFTSTTSVDGALSLDDYVVPGMYFLTVTGDQNVTGPFAVTPRTTISADLPDARSQVVTLDPNAGSIAAANLNVVDETPGIGDPYAPEYVSGPLEAFRTTFYRVVAPGAVQSGLTAAAVAFNPPAGPNQGRASFAVYKQTNPATYVLSNGPDGLINLDPDERPLGSPPDDKSAVVTTSDVAQPGDVYYLSLNRDRLFRDTSHVDLSAQFNVPQSGIPDIVVDPIRLDPAGGQTRVTVSLHNSSYATAGVFRSVLHFSNYPTDATITIPGVGPLATQTYTYLWNPTNTGDTVTYTADAFNQVAERNELNNQATVALTKQRPSVSVALNDPLLDGNPNPAVWGRYLNNVTAYFRVVASTSDPDGPSDIYQTSVNVPRYGNFVFTGGTSNTTGQLDFGQLQPTTGTTPNILRYSAIDQWGLRSDERTLTIEVVPRPSFYTSISFNPATRRYDLGWVHDIVRYDKSISDILGFNMPLVGDKRQKFVIGLRAATSAGLNSNDPVSLPLAADVQLTAFDKDFFNESWTGTKQITDNFYARTSLEVSPKTLDVTAAAVSFQLRNLPLLNIRTPKVPLFSFGVPGVAAISANFSFGLGIDLDAGIKVGLDPTILTDPFRLPDRVGLMSPTFVQPSITGTAYISGDVEVFGFDLASIEGSIGLTLNIAVGLDNGDRSAVIPFRDLADRLAVKVTGSVNFGLSASVIIIGEIWSWEDSIPFDIADTSKYGGVITTEPGVDFGAAGAANLDAGMQALAQFASGQIPTGALAAIQNSQPTRRRGSDPVGPYPIAAAPQLVIDPATGNALSVQTVDLDPGPANTMAGLVFANRNGAGGAWSALSPIAGTGDVGNPVLALSHDAGGNGGGATPAVLVYEDVDLPGAASAQPLAQRLAGRNLRYRYWDGAGWGAQKSLTDLAGGDSDFQMAFNNDGEGVGAWVHNTNPVPMGEDGIYDRNSQEIYAARWIADTHQWGPGQRLTTDAVADSQPATFVDANGKLYVVWIRDNGDGTNALYYSTNDGNGGGWSAPAELQIDGLAAGGKFTSVALGSEFADRVNVLFNYRKQNDDRSLDSKLYNRATTLGGFDGPATVEVIADRTNFSHLRTTNAPDGSLVASWGESDGVTNDLFASVLRVGQAWTEPARLTNSPNTGEAHPALAVEPDGTYQILYEVSGVGAADAVGGEVPAAAGVASLTTPLEPDFSFSDPLSFPDERTTAVGLNTPGQATVINRGRTASDVTIEYLYGPEGQETMFDSETVRLSPGSTYLASRDFPVAEGDNRFAIRLVPAGGDLGGPADNLTTHTLQGLGDLEVTSLAPQNPGQPVGPDNPLVATVHNRTPVSLGAFDVTFYAGDPQFPQNPPTVLGTVRVNGMFPGDILPITFDPGAVTEAGVYLYTVRADSGNEIPEAIESNNAASYQLTLSADPRVLADPATGNPNVSAVLLNASGVDNAQVNATVTNEGGTATMPLVVRLMRSLDDGEWIDAGMQATPSLAPGEQFAVQFITAALAGVNRYRVVVESPGGNAANADPANDAGEASLVLNGLADLAVTDAPQVSDPAPQLGRPFMAVATVRNLGIAKAQGVLVELLAYPVGGGSPVTIGSALLDRLDPLSARDVNIMADTSKLAVGAYNLVVVVDGPDDVLEVDDANNASPATRIDVVAHAPARVIGRHVFYNNSLYDGRNVAANAADDGAIAPDKSALLPGDLATFVNVTGYTRGINGVMIDVDNLPADPGFVLDLADFLFRAGRSGSPSAWANAPTPASITLRRGAGEGGTDRVTITWADGGIKNEWLQVTLLGGTPAGLTADDVFYFGNLIGETGDTTGGAALRVSNTDYALVRARQSKPAAIDSAVDLDRNGRVDAFDILTARAAQNTTLPLFTAAGAALQASIVTTQRTMLAPSSINPFVFADERIGLDPLKKEADPLAALV